MPEPVTPGASSVPHDEVWMSFVDGEPLATRTDVGDTPSRLADVASLLADLNSSGVVVTRRRTAAKLLLSLRRKRDDVGGTLAEDVETVVARLGRWQPRSEHLVVNHGDFSPRNLIVRGPDLVLIDFDRLQMADPVHDVAYFGAGLWAVERLLGGHGSWALGDELAQEHAARLADGRDVDDRGEALTFHRAVGLVRIATSWTWMREHPDLAADVVAEARRVASSLPVPVPLTTA
jgi:aminoglycoside phosphotransferase (APT) family kinase protein